MYKISNIMAETNNGLMKKTKAQLVDIILRKDDIEVKLRNEIKAIKEEIDNKNDYIKSKEQCIDDLSCCIEDRDYRLQLNADLIKAKKEELSKVNKQLSDIKEDYDTYATKITELVDNIMFYKKAVVVLSIFIIIELCFLFII